MTRRHTIEETTFVYAAPPRRKHHLSTPLMLPRALKCAPLRLKCRHVASVEPRFIHAVRNICQTRCLLRAIIAEYIIGLMREPFI